MIDKIIKSELEPINKEVIWAKPEEDGYALYMYFNGRWAPAKTIGNGSSLPDNIIAEEDGLYILRSDGNVYPISHPDLSTQPSILPQRFGVFPLKEVLVPNLTNSSTFAVDAEIVPVGVTIIEVSVFNANECVSGHTKKENGSIVITNEQGIVPDFALIRYYSESGNYYYSGGDEEEQEIEVTPARYLTFTAQEDNSSLGLASLADNHKVYYSKDGTLWKKLNTSTNISLQNGDSVFVIGDASNINFGFDSYTRFNMIGKLSARGDITSMLDYKTLDEKIMPYCYLSMFEGCSSLTTAPTLPATTLAEYCYNSMFKGCQLLTIAPELPATTLTENCYYNMFNNCTSLNSITCLATDISARYCTEYWVGSIAASGTFTKAASMSSWTTGANGIPRGWTTVNYVEQ